MSAALVWLLGHPRVALALAALAGAISGAGQAPLAFWPLTLGGLALACLFHLSAPTPRAAALRGWAFGAGYFTATLFWIVEPFFVDAAATAWMAPFALAFMAAGLALFWGAAGWLAKRLRTGALGWALALALAELARSYVFTGFPWALIGHIWADSAPAQLAAFGGPHLLVLFTLAIAAAGALAIWHGRASYGYAAAVLLIAGFAVGGARLAAPTPEGAGQIVRLIQPNAPQAQKWDPAYAPAFFQRQLAFTAAAPLRAGVARPDLIVWPETSIATWMDPNQPNGYLAEMAVAAQGAPVVFGINRDGGGRAYNAAFVMGPDGQVIASYDKHHLVPFGEYIPAGWLLSRIGLRAFTQQAGYGFSAGAGPQVIDLPNIGPALPLICYEAIFPNDMRADRRPALLLQITNDAWFGALAGPQQHLAQARLRAIEQGLPMVRVANTGISAMIDAHGRVTARLPLGGAGWLDAPLPAPMPATLYARSGDLPWLLLIVVAFAASSLLRRESD